MHSLFEALASAWLSMRVESYGFLQDLLTGSKATAATKARKQAKHNGTALNAFTF